MTNFEEQKTHSMYLQVAGIIASGGTCKRLQVGAVITQHRRIVSTGWNGTFKGTHCIMECDIQKPCTHAIHAEANAIFAAAKEGIALDGATIYCTHSPCLKCAEAIIQAGIKEVYFLEEFRDKAPIELLRNNHVNVCHAI